MALKSLASKYNSVLLGICMPSLRHNASKIKCQTLELDESILMYFKHYTTLFAYDPKKICKTGDIVLIKPRKDKPTSSITHEVIQVIYPFGDITDPISGKLVVGSNYRDTMEEIQNFYGKSENSFNYKTAPKRGWQQGKKDFSHRETYLRYNEFDKDDENHEQPYSSYY